MSENGGFGRRRGGQDNVGAPDARENWKFFENCLWFNPIFAKHGILVAGLTCDLVAKTELHKFLVFLKIFKTEHFPKTTKNTQKSFYVWSIYDWVCTPYLNR